MVEGALYIIVLIFGLECVFYPLITIRCANLENVRIHYFCGINVALEFLPFEGMSNSLVITHDNGNFIVVEHYLRASALMLQVTQNIMKK